MELIAEYKTIQLLIFEVVVGIMIISSSSMIYLKTKELFRLSLQKGLNYFYRAFLVYTFCFAFNLMSFLVFYFIPSIKNSLIINIIFGLLTLYTGALGGIYLGYSLMWRRFEKDRIKKPHIHIYLIAHGSALLIAVIQIFFTTRRNIISPFFFIVMLLYLIIAIYINRYCYDQHCHKKNKDPNPFMSSILLSLFIYAAMFIESILFPILPTIHFIVWGLIVVFMHAVEHNVRKVCKGEL